MTLAKEEKAPPGMWTANSRPLSLLPEKRHERRLKRRAKVAALKELNAKQRKADTPEQKARDALIAKLQRKLHRRK
ncbi:hypothetical protein GUITHDRAFT_154540 [Guillardia theta CCMP2712]|uniref:Uncharacterized protein n=1 Tax=Guillardia theta (strain CCMP2712) TaxID=905079 RepID=L1IRV8_GUITC|nr:hypothetical protein GUITHDRAFT_154540 [Guillardia theta CCMP2712]EKX39006.1 hypothetical protein GUITHDRAFT_154540 [Guillardia theta CCMP2712]|eukprot:XP_005825986.1 hypothetical protein GUITHDRAFT_154540 [Guillardia theta CCMP2712]